MSDEIDRILAMADRKPAAPTGGDELDRILAFADGAPAAPGYLDRAKGWLADLAGTVKSTDLKALASDVGTKAKEYGEKAIGPALEMGPGALIGGITGGVPGAAAGSALDVGLSTATGAVKGALWGEKDKPIGERMKRGVLDFSPTAALAFGDKEKKGPTWQSTAGEPGVSRLASAAPEQVLSEEDKRAIMNPKADDLPTGVQQGPITREEIEKRREEMYESPTTDILAGLAVTGGLGLASRAAVGMGRGLTRQAVKEAVPHPKTPAAQVLADLTPTREMTAVEAVRPSEVVPERPTMQLRPHTPEETAALQAGEPAPVAERVYDPLLGKVPDKPLIERTPIETPAVKPTAALEPQNVAPPRPVPLAETPADALPARVAAPAHEIPQLKAKVQQAVDTASAPASESVVSGALSEPELALLKAETGEADIGKLRKAGRAVKSFFDPLVTLPDSPKYRAIRNETMGFLGKAEDFIDSIWKKTKVLSPDQKKTIFEFLDGRTMLTDLDPVVQPLANSLQRTNNMIGRMLVKRGMLSQEVFDQYKNQYVHHMYLKHVLGDDHPLVRGMQGGMMDLGELKARTLTATPEGLAKVNAKRARAGENPLTMKEYEKSTLEMQRAIGFIEDVSVAEPVGMAKSLKDIGTNDMLTKVASNPEWVWPGTVIEFEGKKIGVGKLFDELELQRKIVKQAPNVPEAQARLKVLEDLGATAQEAAGKAPADFKQMPKSEKFGPLAGSFVRKEIYNDLVPMTLGVDQYKDFSKTLYYVAKANQKMMNAYKIAHTALNIPTGARNAVSNIVQLNMSGIPLWEMPGWMLKAARSMKAGDQNYVLAKRNGLFKSNFSTGELAEITDTVKTMQGGTWNSMVRGAMKMTKWYGKIDDFYKLAKFIEQRSGGADISTAVIEAQKWGMDYSLAHPAVKVARRQFMPFATYQYKMLPLVAETMARNPWCVLKYQAIPNVMFKVARENLDITDDEWRQLERDLPEFIRTNQAMTVLPVRSEDGRVQWLDYQYYLPWQNILALHRDVKAGEWGEVVTKDIGVNNPVINALAMLTMKEKGRPFKDPFKKKDIYNPLDTPTEKAVKMSEWLYNQFTPSMLQFGEGAVLGKALRMGEPDRTGATITPAKTALSLVGANIKAPKPEAAANERKVRLLQLDLDKARVLKELKTKKGQDISDKKRQEIEDKEQQVWDEYRARKQELLEVGQ